MTGDHAAHLAASRALYAQPRAEELLKHLPMIRSGVNDALDALQTDPRTARAGMAVVTLGGAQRYLQALREALDREGSGADAER